MLTAMWTLLPARLRQVVARGRRSLAPRLLTAAHDLRRNLRVLSWRPVRPELPRRIRIARPGQGRRALGGRWRSSRPMRVVYEQAVVHERPSLRARLVGRSARMFVKPLLLLMPLNDHTL